MNSIWKKLSQTQIIQRVNDALEENINYNSQSALGIPASYLDEKVFNQDASFLKDSPFISTLIKNPNHIGCHTLGKTEYFFKGTQKIEKEVLDICAIDIFKSKKNGYDGYIASGGTEANIQAIWIYRNYFLEKYSAKKSEVTILCTQDSHYSMDKAANLLGLDIFKISVDSNDRSFSKETIKEQIKLAKNKNKKYFIVVANMMTTMFGSVDNINLLTTVLSKTKTTFKLHIDGAFGGFYHPFCSEVSQLTFENPHINSFTLDAHKMAQAPYGTGIFIIRKNYMAYTNTNEASYVKGEDFTLIGSRSGANAVAIWMILVKNGPFGWQEKIFILQKRSDWICKKLSILGIEYYRHRYSNIITLKSKYVTKKLAEKYGLIPDNHKAPSWYKIVVMDHVTIEKLEPLLKDLKKNIKTKL